MECPQNSRKRIYFTNNICSEMSGSSKRALYATPRGRNDVGSYGGGVKRSQLLGGERLHSRNKPPKSSRPTRQTLVPGWHHGPVGHLGPESRSCESPKDSPRVCAPPRGSLSRPPPRGRGGRHLTCMWPNARPRTGADCVVGRGAAPCCLPSAPRLYEKRPGQGILSHTRASSGGRAARRERTGRVRPRARARRAVGPRTRRSCCHRRSASAVPERPFLPAPPPAPASALPPVVHRSVFLPRLPSSIFWASHGSHAFPGEIKKSKCHLLPLRTDDVADAAELESSGMADDEPKLSLCRDTRLRPREVTPQTFRLTCVLETKQGHAVQRARRPFRACDIISHQKDTAFGGNGGGGHAGRAPGGEGGNRSGRGPQRLRTTVGFTDGCGHHGAPARGRIVGKMSEGK